MAEVLIRLSVEQLSEGVCLVTSEDIPGLVAPGRAIAEAVEIAQDVAHKLIESYPDHGDPLPDGLKGVFSGHGEVITPIGVD